MPDKTIEEKVRDHDEDIRNLNRITGEIVSALRSLHEKYRKGHEYQLMETRLQTEEIKDFVTTTIKPLKKEIEDVKVRVTCFELLKSQAIACYKWTVWVIGIIGGSGTLYAVAKQWQHHGHKIVDKVIKP